MYRIIASIMTIALLGGCVAFPPAKAPDTPIALPTQFSMYNEGEPGPDRWWEAFDSDELNRLVNEALSGNFDVRKAWSRLKQADAVARQAGADLLPSVDYSAGAEKSWQQTKTEDTDRESSDSEFFSAGVAVSYELDLWGRLHALRQSDVFEFKAAREDLEAAAVTVSAEVATTWLDILSTRRQIAILKDQIDINQHMLKLLELRFMNGRADALDISQQREALAAAKAKLPPLQQNEQQQLNALVVLLGRAGAQKLTISQATLPTIIPLPGTGLPADLLAARPDVRAAGLRLRADDWQISAARADRLPAVTLSADMLFSSDSFNLLFSNWVGTLAASLTGPLFDGGYRTAEVDRTRAVAEESLNDYARTVAEAIREVEDSLVTEKRQGEYIQLLEDQLQASRLTFKDAHLQYMNGQDNYLDYLTAWSSVQELERQLVDEESTLIKNRVTLYRALGGDWTQDLVSGNNLDNERGASDLIADIKSQASNPEAKSQRKAAGEYGYGQ